MSVSQACGLLIITVIRSRKQWHDKGSLWRQRNETHLPTGNWRPALALLLTGNLGLPLPWLLTITSSAMGSSGCFLITGFVVSSTMVFFFLGTGSAAPWTFLLFTIAVWYNSILSVGHCNAFDWGCIKSFFLPRSLEIDAENMALRILHCKQYTLGFYHLLSLFRVQSFIGNSQPIEIKKNVSRSTQINKVMIYWQVYITTWTNL